MRNPQTISTNIKYTCPIAPLYTSGSNIQYERRYTLVHLLQSVFSIKDMSWSNESRHRTYAPPPVEYQSQVGVGPYSSSFHQCSVSEPVGGGRSILPSITVHLDRLASAASTEGIIVNVCVQDQCTFITQTCLYLRQICNLARTVTFGNPPKKHRHFVCDASPRAQDKCPLSGTIKVYLTSLR